MFLQLANGNTLALASGGKLMLSGYYAAMLADAICEFETAPNPKGYFLGEVVSEVVSDSSYGGHFTFEANPEFITTVGLNARFLAEAIAEAITSVPRYIPERPTRFKAVRSGSTITLTWTDPEETYKIQVLAASGEREASTIIANIYRGVQSLALPTSTDTSYTFQLIPIGLTGNKGKASYIVYSTADSNIL